MKITTDGIETRYVVEGDGPWLTMSHSLDVLDRLEEIDCPTLVIVGEEDHGTPPEMARQIQANVRGAELLVIPSAAHLSNVEQPEAFNQALLSFYERIRK